MGNEVPCPLKLYVVSGSRADYGHLRSLLSALRERDRFLTELIVTGTHLSSQFGNTIHEIEQDNFTIAARIPVHIESDSPSGLSRAFGEAVTQAGEFLQNQPPDCVVVYGDRWEMFAFAVASTLCALPIIHIGGGDITEGAYDECFRHSMTKMSHLHFVTHDDARRRVIQMGEDETSVFNTGSLAIDSLRNVTLMSRDELSQEIGFVLQDKNILVTFHPTTLEADSISEMQEVLRGLAALPPNIGILITQPSFDTGTIQMIQLVKSFIANRSHSKLVSSLGQKRYLSVVAHFDAVVGNSSSGLYEVPSFGKPTVNIGDRQGGRLKASSVIDVQTRASDISEAIKSALTIDCRSAVNPYGDGSAARRMIEILEKHPLSRRTVKKKFHLI